MQTVETDFTGALMTTKILELTDVDLDFYRSEQKGKLSGTRLKPKQAFMEQQFELESILNSDRRYRLYRRHHPTNDVIFSVGLAVCVEGEWLTLCRYNGPYHSHRNFIEKNRLIDVCHIHTATQRYIAGAAHPDGFAEATDRYSCIESAFRCILTDCNITGIRPEGDRDPQTLDLFFT